MRVQLDLIDERGMTVARKSTSYTTIEWANVVYRSACGNLAESVARINDGDARRTFDLAEARKVSWLAWALTRIGLRRGVLSEVN